VIVFVWRFEFVENGRLPLTGLFETLFTRLFFLVFVSFLQQFID
jgi:hypothetical protein